MIFRSGLRLRSSRAQGRAVHLRHDHVGDDEVDRLAGFLQHVDRLHAVAGFQHRVAARGKPAGVERAQAVFILDQKDRALAGEIGAGGRGAARLRRA